MGIWLNCWLYHDHQSLALIIDMQVGWLLPLVDDWPCVLVT